VKFRKKPVVIEAHRFACEFSGIVRDAFRDRGHDAWSCDLLPSERPSEYHLQSDVRCFLAGNDWDLMIAHPPCQHLAVSGARWWREKRDQQVSALGFVRELMAAPIPMIAIENPISLISRIIRKPDQTIQPWMFGHGEQKSTCFWLKGLPKLVPTEIVNGRSERVHRMPPGPDQWRERSRTLEGIANAMADQWGGSMIIDVPPRHLLSMEIQSATHGWNG
jgi:site-specific DNA-cytosine methylase